MKNIISKVILGSLVVGAVGLANAQKIDAKAKKILDDITANYNSKKILTSNFLLEAEPTERLIKQNLEFIMLQEINTN
jgi:hypothetical protein